MIGKEIEKADLNNNFNKCDCKGKDRELGNWIQVWPLVIDE